MNLKFICTENFENAKPICKRVQKYLPNLIYDIEIIRTNGFTKTYQVRHILPKIERIFKPDWDKDIVFVVIFVVIPGVLYFADLELYGDGPAFFPFYFVFLIPLASYKDIIVEFLQGLTTSNRLLENLILVIVNLLTIMP